MKKKIKNKKTLANILLRNYILTYFAVTILVLLIFTFSLIFGLLLYLNINHLNANSASKMMKDDYKAIDSSEVEKLGGYIEVVDDSNKVVYRKGINPNPKDSYTPYEYYRLLTNTEPSNPEVGISQNYENTPGDTVDINYFKSDKYVYDKAYNYNQRFLLIVGVPENRFLKYIVNDYKLSPGKFIIITLAFDIGILVLVFILLSKATSRNFIKPLKLLTEGASRISKGDYGTRISLKSKNEFGELRDAFNMMAEEIEKERLLKENAEENRKNLILDISHDLKNPLSSIQGYSEYILKNPGLSHAELVNYLEIIRLNSQRANDLIQDLFEYSALVSSDFNLNMKTMDINEFLRKIIASYIPLFEKKHMNYDFQIPERKTYLPFDELQLDRAISNLIINSIKYNPESTDILIKAGPEINHYIIIIQDNGIGIPMELKEDIFHAFVRADTSRALYDNGTGLGLAITKKVIEKHGGTITLESDSNMGTKFTITLPFN
ncbi:MAG: HAMP domain-containing sensor histidine kinase [Bacillota bacterium]|nr:HAMP domain-containing sensor histidine kinase [Bacillota bacterium]